MKTVLTYVLTHIGRLLIRIALVKTSELLKNLEYKGKGEYQYKKQQQKGKSYTENEM